MWVWNRPIGASCALALMGGQIAAASDWPQFRGPNGSGIAPGDARPPLIWSDTHSLKWRVALPGPGSSSPIVWGDRVFVTCYTGYGVGRDGGTPENLKRHLICVERQTGKILWNAVVPAEFPEDPFRGYLTQHGYASNTPVTDGERVNVYFGKTGALAFDFAGKQLWKVNLGKDSSNRRWGSAASPVLYKNTVIVNAAEESRSIYALERSTGKVVWKAEADSLELCYGTPALVDCGGGRTDLVLAVPGELWGMNPETGKLRWLAETGIAGNVSPSVAVADGVVVATGGFPRQSTVAVRTGGKGDVTQSHVLWSSLNASYVPSPVVVSGHVYVVNDKGFAMCLEAASGKLVYKERLPDLRSARGGGSVYASTVWARGHLYAVSRRSGTYVLEASPEFKVVAHNRLSGDESDFNATPAIVGRQLFIRSNEKLYCIEAAE